jgi:hypothetical protein
MTKAKGFGKRRWGGKPRLDPRVVNIIQSRVEAGEAPPTVLEMMAKIYQIIEV